MVSIKVAETDSGVVSPEGKSCGEELPSCDEPSCNGKAEPKESIITSSVTTEKPAMILSNKSVEDEDEEDEDYDESLVERLAGLSEMFPASLRNAACSVTNGAFSFIKGTYALTRQVVWVGVSSSIILFAPVMFELERFNVEEMVKQDRNRLVLGPGSAMSGTPGLAPPPTR